MPAPEPVKADPSEARLRANRLNAQNSSGPKSIEGKKRSCLNATRHGILSQTVHFPEEEMKAYTEFGDNSRNSASSLPAIRKKLKTLLQNALGSFVQFAIGSITANAPAS